MQAGQLSSRATIRIAWPFFRSDLDFRVVRMAELSILSFTIRDLVECPSSLRSLSDPHGYLDTFGVGGLELLRTNPYTSDADLAAILAIDGDLVVGRLGLYAGLLIYDSQKMRTFWLSGFFLDQKYKRTGIGGLMLLKAVSFSKCLILSGGPRADTERLYEGTGLRKIAHLQRFVYFYGTESLARKIARNQMLVSALAASMKPFLRAYYAARRGRGTARLRYEETREFGGEIDALLEREARNMLLKDSKTLNWVLRHKRCIWAYRVFRYRDLIGYCLLKKYVSQVEGVGGQSLEIPVGCLLDYFLSDESLSVKRDLILFSLDSLGRQEVDAFECQVLDPELARICKGLGMVHLGGNRAFFHPPEPKRYDPNARWFLTHGTADVILLGS